MIQSADKIQKIKELLRSNPRGMSVTDLVDELGVNKNSIGRYLDTLLASGQVDMRRYGMAKVYTISNRVPLNAMLSISSDLILLLDSNMGIVNANDPFLSVLQLTPKDILGKNLLYSPLVPFFGGHFDRVLDRIVSGLYGESWEGEIAAGPPGSEGVFSCRIVPTVFESGQIGVSITLSDIGEKKVREEQLRFQADLLQDVNEAVIATDREGSITYWNKAAESLFLYPPQEALGKNFYPLILTDARAPDTIRSFLTTQKKRWSGEYMAVRKDRTRVPISLSMSPRFNESRAISGFIGIASDISAQKRADKRLRESELRYHTLFDSVLDGTILLDTHATVLMINAAAARMFGIEDRGSAVGKDALDFITPESREAAGDYITGIKNGRYMAENGHFPPMELECRTSAGKKFWVEVVGTSIVYDETPLLLFTMRDITRRRDEEKAIREGEEKYRMLFENAADMISLYEFGSDDLPGPFLEINDVGCRMLGYSREELLRLAPQDIYDPECIPLMKDTIALYHSRHHVIFNRVYVTKDHRRIPVEISAHHFVREGKDVVLSISRDITGQKKQEADLRFTRELLSGFMGMMEPALWSVDPASGTCLFMSPGQETVTCWPDSFFASNPYPWVSVIHPDDRKKYGKMYRGLKKTKKFELRYRILLPDGGLGDLRDIVQLDDRDPENPRIYGMTYREEPAG